MNNAPIIAIPLIGAALVATAVTSVLIPVLVAALTGAVALALSRASEAANRRRDRYAEAVAALVAWVEFPYRVRRRTDDTPATLAALAARGHELQEKLAGHQAWILAENSTVATAYRTARTTITPVVGAAIREAWATGPAATAEAMNLGDWGPAKECSAAICDVEKAIANRFTWTGTFKALGR